MTAPWRDFEDEDTRPPGRVESATAVVALGIILALLVILAGGWWV